MPTASIIPNTLGDVFARVQALMGDPTGSWVSRNYALPFIQQAYEDMETQLKNASGKNLEAIIEILGVPIGTSSLYSYQTYGDPSANPVVARGALAGLFDPLRLWVKTAGALPQYYTEAKGPRDTLPFVNPPGITPGNYAVQVFFAWIGNQLSITPVAQAIDIKVYGRFNAPPLVQDTDKLVLYDKMTAPLAYSAAALMGVERTNPQILQGYIERAQATIDNIIADIIRQTQKNPRRLAKMGGQSGCGWGWGGSGVW